MQTPFADNSASFPLIDPLDHEILMHLQVHFGGSFSAMRDYYERKGKGIRPEFTLERIDELERMQESSGSSLSDEVLFEQEKQEIALAKERYRSLKALCWSSEINLSGKIADLIFSEEEEPHQEIAALAAEGGQVVSSLIELLSSEDFYNPLSPGYGEAPALAARCLGLIGDERAICPLFQALGRDDFFTEEAIFDALAQMGENAKKFLLNALQTLPVTKENEQAAIALIGFKEDPRIAQVCLKMLLQENNIRKPTFAAYLAIGCHGLTAPIDQEEFIILSQRPNLPLDLRQEMDVIIQKWKKKLPLRRT